MKKNCKNCGKEFASATPQTLCETCKYPVCLQCGKTFETFYSRLKKGEGKYCSQRCAALHKPLRYWTGKKRDPHTLERLQEGKLLYLKRYEKENKLTTQCEICGKTFSYYPKHQIGRCCSRKCTAIMGKREVKNPGAPPIIQRKKQCRYCGAEFDASGYRKKHKQFCSQNCFRRWNSEYQREHPQERLYTTRRGYREDLECYFRSSWEANYARYLNFIGAEWKFEPRRFVLFDEDGSKKYYWPDFLVDRRQYIEVKGYEHPRGMRKLELFKEQYPDIPITVIGKEEYGELSGEYGEVISFWE